MVKNNKNNNSPPLYVLPSDNNELQSFAKKFKDDIMEHVVDSIEFAVKYELPFVEVFQFKNSDFVITLSEKDYLTNLDNVYSYYMKKEIYECCSRIVVLRKLLTEKFVININENKTK